MKIKKDMLQLKSLRLKNWFNFKDTTIEFGEGPHCLVGVNGIGKTNIGKALYLVKQMSLNEKGIEEVIEKFGGFKAVKNSIDVNEEAVELEFEFEDIDHKDHQIKKIEYRLTIGFNTKLWMEETLIPINFQNQRLDPKVYKSGSDTSYKSYPYQSVLNFTRQSGYIESLLKFFQNVEVLFPFDLSQTSLIRKKLNLSSETQVLSEDLSNYTSIILDWKKEHRAAYQNLIKQLKNIKHTYNGFDAMAVKTNEVDMYVDESGLERYTYIGNLSEGTLKYILLLLIILNPNKPSFIFMDEPDTHLHPDMISNLFRLFNEIGTQSLITTHNPLFVDRFEREQILYLTFSEEEGTKVNKAADVYVGEEDVAEPNLLTPYELFLRGYLG